MMRKKIGNILKIGLLAGSPALAISFKPNSHTATLIKEKTNLNTKPEISVDTDPVKNNLVDSINKEVSPDVITPKTESSSELSLSQIDNSHKAKFKKAVGLVDLEWNDTVNNVSTKITKIDFINQINDDQFVGYGSVSTINSSGSSAEKDLFMLKINDEGVENISKLNLSIGFNEAIKTNFNNNIHFKNKENYFVSAINIKKIIKSQEGSKLYMNLNWKYENIKNSKESFTYYSILKLDLSQKVENITKNFEIKFVSSIGNEDISLSKNYIFFGNPNRNRDKSVYISYISLEDFKPDSSHGTKLLRVMGGTGYINGVSKLDNNGTKSPISYNFFYSWATGGYGYGACLIPYEVENIETKDWSYFTKKFTGLAGLVAGGQHINSQNSGASNIKIGIAEDNRAYFSYYLGRWTKKRFIWRTKITKDPSESIHSFLSRTLENSLLWSNFTSFSGAAYQYMNFIVDNKGNLNILDNKDEQVYLKNYGSKDFKFLIGYDENKFSLSKLGIHDFKDKYLFFDENGKYAITEKHKNDYTSWLSFAKDGYYYKDSNLSNLPFDYYKSLYYNGNQLININDMAISNDTIVVLYENSKLKIFDIKKSTDGYLITENTNKSFEYNSSTFNSIEFIKEKNLFVLNKVPEDFDFTSNIQILNHDGSKNIELTELIDPSTSILMSGTFNSYDLDDFKIDKYNPLILGYSKIKNTAFGTTNYVPIPMNKNESIKNLSLSEYKDLTHRDWLVHPESGLIVYEWINSKLADSKEYKVIKNGAGELEVQVKTTAGWHSFDLYSANNITSPIELKDKNNLNVKKSLFGNGIMTQFKKDIHRIRLFPFNFEKENYNIKAHDINILATLNEKYKDGLTKKNSKNQRMFSYDIKMIDDETILFMVDDATSSTSSLIFYDFLKREIVSILDYDRNELKFETFNKDSNIKIIKDMNGNMLIPYTEINGGKNKYWVVNSNTFEKYDLESNVNNIIEKKSKSKVKLEKINLNKYGLKIEGEIGSAYLSVKNQFLLENDNIHLISYINGKFRKIDLKNQTPLPIRLNEKLNIYAEFGDDGISNVNNWVLNDGNYQYSFGNPLELKADDLPIPDVNVNSIKILRPKMTNNKFTSNIEDKDILARISSNPNKTLNRLTTISDDIFDVKSDSFFIDGIDKFWADNEKFINKNNTSFWDIFQANYKVYNSKGEKSFNVLIYDFDVPPQNLKVGDMLEITLTPKGNPYKFQNISSSFLIDKENVINWNDLLKSKVVITDSSNNEEYRYLKVNSLKKHLDPNLFWAVSIKRNSKSKLENITDIEYVDNRIILEENDEVTLKLMSKDSESFETNPFKTIDNNDIEIKKKITNISPLKGSREILEVDIEKFLTINNYETELFSLVKGSPRDPLHSIHLNEGLKETINKQKVESIFKSKAYEEPYVLYKLGDEDWSRTSPGKLNDLRALSVKVVVEEKIGDPSEASTIIQTKEFNPKPMNQSELSYSKSKDSLKNGEYMIWVYIGSAIAITSLIAASIIFIRRKRRLKIKKIAN